MARGKSRRSLELIEASIEILEEIQPATVRAVCYRLFTRGLISSMSKGETNKVGHQLVWAREMEHIPWSWIVDETRHVEGVRTWADPAEYAATVTRAYHKFKWEAQPRRIEVWSEKGTVRGTLKPVLDEFEVPFRVMHGFASATAVKQIVDTSEAGPLLALYVGDWDPSGLHMSEVDLPKRLEEYGAAIGLGDGLDTLEIRRVALIAEDVADPALPHFEAETKRGDPRYSWYVRNHGRKAWELDAMDPRALRERGRSVIESELDWTAWNRYVTAEKVERESITAFASHLKSISVPASEYAEATGAGHRSPSGALRGWWVR